MSQSQNPAVSVMRSSLVWGGLASLGFFTLLHAGVVPKEIEGFVWRYFAGHWIEYVETTLFFIGLAELILRAGDVSDQLSKVDEPLLGPTPAAPRPVKEAKTLVDQLSALSASRRSHYLPRRLTEALVRIMRKGSADSLDDELKYLADVDADHAHAAYGFIRIIIWAIPILGFLGTVIGITIAIAQLSPDALEESLPQVTSGLGVAFDTTALALGLSMVLMFSQFKVDRMEQKLLDRVDQRAAVELAGRFEQLGEHHPQLGLVRRLAETVLRATERTVEQQAELWRATIDSAHERWMQLTSATQEQLETAIGATLDRSLRVHADRLAEHEAVLIEATRQHWSEVRQTLDASAASAQAQTSELSRQGDILLNVVEATGEVARLEHALNGNLAALSSAQHFEEAMLGMSAALNLLNARLQQIAGAPSVALKEPKPASRAA